MNEFKYFIDIVPERKFSPTKGFYWGDNSLSGFVFEQLKDEFKKCEREFEGYIMTFGKDDRVIVAEKTLSELIIAANRIEEYRGGDCATHGDIDNSCIFVEMTLHNGVKSLFYSLSILKIDFTKEFLQWVSCQSGKPWIKMLIAVNRDIFGFNPCEEQPNIERFSKIEKAAVLLEELTKRGFVDKDTGEDGFLYWFGGSNTVVANRINWIAKLKDLSAFINTFYPNEPDKWKKAVACFVWNGGDIKRNSLSTAIAKYDNAPESGDIFEAIRTEIR